MTKTTTQFLQLALGFILCSASAHAEPPVLRMSLPQEPRSLEWNDPRLDADRFIVPFMMRGMTKVDAGGNVVCDLCKTKVESPESKSIRFTLNDAAWSDGVKLAPAHFVDAFKRVADSAAFHHVKKFYADGETLVLELKDDEADILRALSQPYTFPIRKESKKFSDGPTLGPYMLAAWEKSKRIVLEGNPEFKDKRPVYRVDFSLGTHKELTEKFAKGKLDILSAPSTEDLKRFRGQKIQVTPMLATRAFVFNFKRKATRDLNVRKWIAASLHRESVNQVMKNGERSANSIVPPSLPGARQLPWLTSDIARAKEESTRLSSALGTGLEILLERDPGNELLGAWLLDEFKAVGAKVVLKWESAQNYNNRLEKGDFDIALVMMNLRSLDPLDVLNRFKSDSSQNYGAYTSVAFDSFMDRVRRAQKSADVGAVASLVEQATQVLEREDIAVLPIGHPTRAFLLGTRVKEFAVTQFGDPDFLKIRLQE